jgi:peptidoglycan/xylan/chitin deacetylase (PgdA/CDA1 family)
MRAAFKRLAEKALLYGGPAIISRRRFRNRTLILAYHNVYPDGIPPEGDRSLHLSRAVFTAQLEILAGACDIISLDDVFTGSQKRGRPRVAITFDDAYQGCVTVAVPELARRGMPATIFVPPGFIGGRSFWWDALTGPGAPGLDEPVRNHALVHCRGIDQEVRDWAGTSGRAVTEPGPLFRTASEDELHGAARTHPELRFGSHTWGHPNLAVLDPAALANEFAQPLQWLRPRFANLTSWISFPYGMTSPAALVAARTAGHHAGLLVAGGWTKVPPVEPMLTPRFNIPADLSVEGFELRLSGLLAA